jgi:hypothetical protein
MLLQKRTEFFECLEPFILVFLLVSIDFEVSLVSFVLVVCKSKLPLGLFIPLAIQKRGELRILDAINDKGEESYRGY